MKKSVEFAWVKNNIQKINVIDVRSKNEYSQKHLEGTTNIPMGELLKNPSEFIDPHKTYYIMCNSGGRAFFVVASLEKKGFTNLIHISGGAKNL